MAYSPHYTTRPRRAIPSAPTDGASPPVSNTGLTERENKGIDALDNRKLLTVGQCVKLYGVSSQTLRSWVRRNLVLSVRQGMGWNRIVKESLESYMGIKAANEQLAESERKIGLYIRRSSAGTKDRLALDTQQNELLTFCQQEYGVDVSKVLIFREQTSGVSLNFETRKELKRLWDSITQNKISVLVIKDKSRLARVDCHSLFEAHCKEHGTRLVYVHNWSDADNDELKDEISVLLDFLTHYTQKRSAKKSAYNRVILIEGETRETLIRLHKQGLSIKAIEEYAKKNEIYGRKNNGDLVPISRGTIFNFLRRYCKITAVIKDDTSVLTEYYKQRIRKQKGGRIPSNQVYQDYTGWCQKNGLLLCSHQVLSHYLGAQGFKFSTSGSVRWVHGLRLKEVGSEPEPE